jgi:hypothetical protein
VILSSKETGRKKQWRILRKCPRNCMQEEKYSTKTCHRSRPLAENKTGSFRIGKKTLAVNWVVSLAGDKLYFIKQHCRQVTSQGL